MAVVRELWPDDHEWLVERLTESWGATRVVSRGRLIEAAALPGLVAEHEGERAGLATYEIVGGECELVTMNSWVPGKGVGTALMEALVKLAWRAGCERLCVITTNDNTDALRFYQRHGFRLAVLRPDAVARYRRMKPEIPETGKDGIPIRDELELEIPLAEL